MNPKFRTFLTKQEKNLLLVLAFMTIVFGTLFVSRVSHENEAFAKKGGGGTSSYPTSISSVSSVTNSMSSSFKTTSSTPNLTSSVSSTVTTTSSSPTFRTTSSVSSLSF